jgi:hypothetical protein
VKICKPLLGHLLITLSGLFAKKYIEWSLYTMKSLIELTRHIVRNELTLFVADTVTLDTAYGCVKNANAAQGRREDIVEAKKSCYD